MPAFAAQSHQSCVVETEVTTKKNGRIRRVLHDKRLMEYHCAARVVFIKCSLGHLPRRIQHRPSILSAYG